jgi:hypothetical protein
MLLQIRGDCIKPISCGKIILKRLGNRDILYAERNTGYALAGSTFNLALYLY